MASRALTSRQGRPNCAQCKPGLHLQSDATSCVASERFDLGGLWERPQATSRLRAAAYDIGQLYANGVDVPADLALAREWMQKVADAGNEPAKRWLAAPPK
jgi:TPR repeat protein